MSEYHHIIIFLAGIMVGGASGAIGMALLTFDRMSGE